MSKPIYPKGGKEMADKMWPDAAAPASPGVDEILDKLAVGLTGEMPKLYVHNYTYWAEAKASLLAHDLALMPEKLYVENSVAEAAFNKAIDLMEQRLRESYGE